MLLQYGRIIDIELKLPPRPPGYCFVEVGTLHLGIHHRADTCSYETVFTLSVLFNFCSLRILGMLKMQLEVVMAITLMVVF